MKTLLVFLFHLLIFSSLAQDVIVQTNGDEIEAKVIEITDVDIKYKAFDHLDGPVRSIKQSLVFMIIYENGKREKFNTTETKETPKTTEPKLEEPKDLVRKNGFFIETVLSSGYYERGVGVGACLRLGNKFYGKHKEKYSGGIQLTWIRGGIMSAPSDNHGIGYLSPMNFGPTHIHSLGLNKAIETNVNLGYALTFYRGREEHGALLSFDVKYRYKYFVTGIDCAGIFMFTRDDVFFMGGLVLGIKF